MARRRLPSLGGYGSDLLGPGPAQDPPPPRIPGSTGVVRAETPITPMAPIGPDMGGPINPLNAQGFMGLQRRRLPPGGVL